MTGPRLESLSARIAGIAPVYPVGRVTALNEATLQVAGFAADAALGDQVEIRWAARSSASTAPARWCCREAIWPGSHLAIRWHCAAPR
jgi:hypothetical protein